MESKSRSCSIELLHNKLNHINEIDNTGLLSKKKDEELKEVLESIQRLAFAIKDFHNELADNIIVERDRSNFDFRLEFSKQLTKLGVHSLLKDIICQDKVLLCCHEKADRTIQRLENGYYEKEREE